MSDVIHHQCCLCKSFFEPLTLAKIKSPGPESHVHFLLKTCRVSHGYCGVCLPKVQEEWGVDPQDEKEKS